MQHNQTSNTSEEQISTTHEMVQYRERLIKQKEFLVDVLSKIEKQILALQVERLHLKNTLLGSECSNQDEPSDAEIENRVKSEPITVNRTQQNPTEQQLDLSIPQPVHNYEETEDEGDEKQMLEYFDTLF